MAEATLCLKQSFRTDLIDAERSTLAAQSSACSLLAISNILLALVEDASYGSLLLGVRDRLTGPKEGA
jgi:hypothetical protein